MNYMYAMYIDIQYTLLVTMLGLSLGEWENLEENAPDYPVNV